MTPYSLGAMTTTKEVAVETDLAVRWLVARWAQLVDDGDLKAATELFTEDGRFRILDQDLRGRAAIEEWLGTVPSDMSHLVTNLVVSYGSQPGTIHAVSDVQVAMRRDGQWSVVMLARYHDTFVGEGRGIRLSQRICTSR